jgi:hypothetical protein
MSPTRRATRFLLTLLAVFAAAGFTTAAASAHTASKPVEHTSRAHPAARHKPARHEPPRKATETATPAGVHVTLTTRTLSDRLTAMPNVAFSRMATGRTPVISVNDGVRYQQVRGFGAAMTDSSAWLLDTQLSPAERAAAMTSLFGSSGIHLNFLRVPMGASDFTATGTPYTYDDMPPGQSDPTL